MDGSGTLPVKTGTNWVSKGLIAARMLPFAMAKGGVVLYIIYCL